MDERQRAVFGEVMAAMLEPSLYPHEVDDVEVRETAISMVFLAGERVYKVKKPVTLPFLDYADPRRRRALCHEEVRLNRRLAPETYLGVRAIVRRDGGFALVGDHADATEWAVEMRRLPQERTMASLLEAGRLTAEHAERVGRRLAAFHEQAPAPREPPGPSAVKRPIDENFQPLLDLDLPGTDRRRLAAAERFFDAFVTGRSDLLSRRAASGRVRDGHGDLRLEHVLVLDDDVLAYDCVEFDAELRQIDVAADLGFLVMELVARDADDLSRALVNAYRDAGGDPGDDALLSFYAAYRAWVRAKLAYLAGQDADTLVAAGERLRWHARLPLLLVFCGVTASGKSTIAGLVAAASGLAALDSDHVRKELAGIEPTARAAPEQYGPEANRRTYHELGRRAADHLRRRGGAIVDATFRRREERDAFSAGLGQPDGDLVYVECRAPRRTLFDRAHARERDPARLSDATGEMVDRQLAEWEPLDEVEAGAHLTLRSDRDATEIADELEALLDQRLTASGA